MSDKNELAVVENLVRGLVRIIEDFGSGYPDDPDYLSPDERGELARIMETPFVMAFKRGED